MLLKVNGKVLLDCNTSTILLYIVYIVTTTVYLSSLLFTL